MPAMSSPAEPSESRAFYRAVAVSLAIHALVLALPHAEPNLKKAGGGPLQATLAPRASAPTQTPTPQPIEPPKASSQSGRPKPQDILHAAKPKNPAERSVPTWSVAQKAEMDSFLNELAEDARREPPPTLAQRALAQARQAGREMARADESAEALLERRANSEAPNPFSLEFYLDGMVRRLNRSAAFVNSEPRHKGVQTAAVQFRLNPDGTLKSFVVLNAADQADEIAFIKEVIERSLPFSPFPPDIDKAARSLGVTICIRPSRDREPGFSRMKGGRCF